ncbi:hypothetical protein ABZ468_07880 [Streptomyces sp. NPDC005708]|uniref:hypothetical protein n=1 Tax=Streptomyces sp. NPDC005708 TaxID=3154564 RepID=UPI0033F07F78
MAEGLQAGRLDVPVVADLAGFAAKLRAEVESAAEGLAAKIKVKIDDKGLRKQLKKAVEEASKGVTAKVKVKVDEERFRAELDALRRRVDDTNITLPVRPNGDDSDRRGGGLINGVRNLIRGAQDEANRNPVNVPTRMNLPSGRRLLRPLAIGSLISLLQPAVALIGQYGAGLTALVSAAAPAVGVLGAIPGLIAAAGTAAIGTKLAFSGFGAALQQTMQVQQQQAAGMKVTKAEQQKLEQSLKGLSTSAKKTVTTVASLSGAWRKMKQSIQERFFSRIADDVKPLSNAVLPLLKNALGDSADQMGKLAERGAKFMKSGVFRKDFKTIAGTNSRVLGNLTNGLGNMGRATLDFMVASGPFVERVSRAGERMTQWFRASVQAGRETGSLAKFLDHAGDKAAQLGRTTGSLIKGLGGVGKAAMETGNTLLDGLEGSMKRFERYAQSGAGQKAMKQLFSDAAPAFHEVNLLFGDLMRSFGHAMHDGGITDLIRQIRLELGPALGNFFSNLGHNVGPAVVSLISNLATAIGDLSSAGSGLGLLLTTVNGFLQALNGAMNWLPGLGTALGVVLAAMLALKVTAAVTTIFRNFGTSVTAAATAANASVRGLGTTMRGQLGPNVLGPQVTGWQRIGLAYQSGARQGNILTGTLRGISRANGAAVRAMGGLTNAFGGPLGLAIAGVSIGLGILASKQEAAARATQAHQERVKSLADALAASGGAIDANVRAQAVQLLQDTQLRDGKGRLVDMMAKAGVGIGQLTDAYLGQGTTLDKLQKDLQATADANIEVGTAGTGAAKGWNDQGLAAIRAHDALGTVRGELENGIKKNKEFADGMKQAGDTGTTAYDRLQVAVRSFGDQTKSADERVGALKSALDALNGNTQSFHDAEAQLNSVMLQVDDTMKSNIAKADGWGQKLIDNDGLVNTTTKNGQTLNTQLESLRDGMLNVATRAQEAGEQGLIPMSQAMDQSKEAMERARAKAIQLAVDMGIPKEQAKGLADQMGFIPDTITTIVATSGVLDSTAQVLALRGTLDSIKPGKTIQIQTPTAPGAKQQLEALGFTVKALPGGKKISVTAPTDGARVNIAALAQDVAQAPNKKTVTVQAIIKKASGELKNVQQQVAGMKGKSIEVKTPTKLAQQALKDLGYKIQNVDGKSGKKVRITAPNATPLAQVQRIQSAINNLTGRTVRVTVQYTESGKPAVVNRQANGGILRYAQGGIRRTRDRIQSFAAGAERHVAQIARPGEWRLWAEPETGGEAYIPLAPGKRKRSEAILESVAEMFGGQVVYFAQGALRQYAQGALRSSSGGTVRRTAPIKGAAPLVGGDLNMTIGAVASTGTALEDAMYELRRIRLGGGFDA